uniref:BTB domain-containing protein n=2 Tax=Panagrolaimus sp. JU765 TaxID=591449 RepID=A0AC34Q7M2_9BILA
MSFEITEYFQTTFKEDEFVGSECWSPIETILINKKFELMLYCRREVNDVSLYLHVRTGLPIFADFKCIVNSTMKFLVGLKFDGNNKTQGFHPFGVRKELFRNGAITVDWTVTLKSNLDLAKRNEARQPISTFLLEDRVFSDFVIICEGQEFKVHKNILAFGSTVFATMLQQNCQETRDGRLTIDDFTHSVVDSGIKLIYKRKLDDTLDLQQTLHLWLFAEKYDLIDKDCIDIWITENINEENVCEIANFAKENSVEKTYEKCLNFFVDNFIRVTNMNKFKILRSDIVKDFFTKKYPIQAP